MKRTRLTRRQPLRYRPSRTWWLKRSLETRKRDPVCRCVCGCRRESYHSAHLVALRAGGSRDKDSPWNALELTIGLCAVCHGHIEAHDPGHGYPPEAYRVALRRLESVTDAELGSIPRSAVTAARAELEARL